MFNSLLRDFEEDPFFSDPFRMHNERIHQMMRGFADPFGQSFMPSVSDGHGEGRRAQGQSSSNAAIHNDQRDVDFFRNPAAMMDSMMSGLRNRMEMNRNLQNTSTDTNSHAFSSSSVMTYSKVGNEPAKVFQASTQTRHAPGGIKETRRTLRDSASGVEQMSIGHHINDRGHVIEKKHNKSTGEREFNQDFQNMDEEEAQAFDEEWKQKVSDMQPTAVRSRLEAPRARAVHRAAITGPEHTRRVKEVMPTQDVKKTHVSELNIQGSSMRK